MRKSGIVVFLIGLVMTIVTGFSFVTKEKVMDFGGMEISHHKDQDVTWSPLVGVAVMIVASGVFFLSPRKPA